jgi:GxxExxY protein
MCGFTLAATRPSAAAGKTHRWMPSQTAYSDSARREALFESAYEEALSHEFGLRGTPFRRQVAVPFRYKEAEMKCVYRVDFVVHGVAIELKSVETLLPLHDAQILTYMRMLRLSNGLLTNFNVKRLANGIRRFLL